MRIILLVFAVIGVFAAIDYFFLEKKWEVQIIFCDNRSPRNIIVSGPTEPNSSDIETSGTHKALSYYYGYQNVCEVKTIRELK